MSTTVTNDTIGTDMFTMATVRHGMAVDIKYEMNEPRMMTNVETDDKGPLSRGSTVSPTYVSMGASLRPMLRPNATHDTYSSNVLSARHSTNQPISCGTLTKAKHHFRPIISCSTPDNRPPVGWHTSSTLPYHDASAPDSVMSPWPWLSSDISDPMTTVGMANDMPKPSIITFCMAIVVICNTFGSKVFQLNCRQNLLITLH